MGDEAKFFTGLAVMAFVLCGGLWFFGRWLSRRVARSKTLRVTSLSLTRAGFTWVAVQVILMVGAVVLFALFPDSPIAQWITRSPGTAIGVFVLLCAIIGGFLGRGGVKLINFKGRDA